jgi:hypothetical protein
MLLILQKFSQRTCLVKKYRDAPVKQIDKTASCYDDDYCFFLESNCSIL